MSISLLNGRYQMTGLVLGKGSFGTTEVAVDLSKQELVVIKKVMGINNRELKVLKILTDPCLPNILCLIDSFTEGGNMYLVTEYHRNTSDLVDWRGSHNINMERPGDFMFMMDMMYQMAAAVAEIHGRGVIHRDLKPDNFLLLDNNRVSLIDFGLACVLGSKDVETMCSGNVGTKRYVAPEVLDRNIGDYSATDIYSLGVTYCVLISGENFDGQVDTGIKKVDDMIKKMLDGNPFRRPTARELIGSIIPGIMREVRLELEIDIRGMRSNPLGDDVDDAISCLIKYYEADKAYVTGQGQNLRVTLTYPNLIGKRLRIGNVECEQGLAVRIVDMRIVG